MTVTFIVATSAFPGGGLEMLLRDLSATRRRRAGRWWCIQEPGVQIWISDVRLADSMATPPTWSVTVETRSPLPEHGKERLAEVLAAIEQFMKNAGVSFGRV